MDWTVEIWRIDRRMRAGQKLVYKTDYTGVELAQMQRMYPQRDGHVVQFRETYVTRRNLMTGVEFSERYDTPWTASPASETYWSA